MTTPPPSSYSRHNRRWYDKYPNIAEAFNSLRDMPSSTQLLFGQIIFQFYEHMSQQRKVDRRALSVGSEKALSMWKTREKRRKEDKDPLLYRALLTLYLIPEHSRKTLAGHISDGLNALTEYSIQCEKHYRSECEEELRVLFRTAMEQGAEAGWEYLRTLGFFLPKGLSAEERVETEKKITSIKSMFKRQRDTEPEEESHADGSRMDGPRAPLAMPDNPPEPAADTETEAPLQQQAEAETHNLPDEKVKVQRKDTEFKLRPDKGEP